MQEEVSLKLVSLHTIMQAVIPLQCLYINTSALTKCEGAKRLVSRLLGYMFSYTGDLLALVQYVPVQCHLKVLPLLRYIQ